MILKQCYVLKAMVIMHFHREECKVKGGGEKMKGGSFKKRRVAFKKGE